MKLETLINTRRKGWLDALRGLAILLVIYGHCIKSMPAYFVFTSPVKMPLFFAISGYVFNAENEVGNFLRQVCRKVVVPWLVLGLIPPVVMIPFMRLNSAWVYFLNMLSGKALWFFPCFIIGELIHFFIRRYVKSTPGIAIVSFCCFAIGLLLRRFDVLNYAMFNRALTVQPFFLIGYLFRNYEPQLINIRWRWIGMAFLVYIGLCFLSMYLFPGKTMDVHLGRYYNIPFCILLVFLGCLILFTGAAKSNFHSWIMSFIGQNTLVLYIWHSHVIKVFVAALSFVGITMATNWWTALFKVIFACFVCGICSIFFNRYLPFVVGKKRVNR